MDMSISDMVITTVANSIGGGRCSADNACTWQPAMTIAHVRPATATTTAGALTGAIVSGRSGDTTRGVTTASRRGGAEQMR